LKCLAILTSFRLCYNVTGATRNSLLRRSISAPDLFSPDLAV
jgi:hypothetical protein